MPCQRDVGTRSGRVNGGLRRIFRRGSGRGMMRSQFGPAAAADAIVADRVAGVALAPGSRGRQPRCCRRALAAIVASLRDARGARTAAYQKVERGA